MIRELIDGGGLLASTGINFDIGDLSVENKLHGELSACRLGSSSRVGSGTSVLNRRDLSKSGVLDSKAGNRSYMEEGHSESSTSTHIQKGKKIGMAEMRFFLESTRLL